MKKESGITLLTLTTYIIGLMIVIGIVTAITNFFMTNVIYRNDSSKLAAEFSKFNLVFVEEVKTYGNSVTELDDDHVIFSTGNKYTFQDGHVYKNKIAIIDDVKSCIFKLKTNEYKQIVSVYIELGSGNTYSKTIDYVVNYDEIYK